MEAERIVLGSAAANEETTHAASPPPDTTLEDAIVGSTGSETLTPEGPIPSAKTKTTKRVARGVEPTNQP